MIEARAERFDMMLDVLGVLFDAGAPLLVLDLASGPAAISVRVLDRFPDGAVGRTRRRSGAPGDRARRAR